IPTTNVQLRGLATTGEGGANEPSLQRILDLWQIPLKVGDNNPADTNYPLPPATPNDEVAAPRLTKAGPGLVSVSTLAAYGNAGSPTLKFGTYSPGTPASKTELFNVPASEAQTIAPATNGTTSFDPGSGPFAIYTAWPRFTNGDGSPREVY